MTVNDPYAAQPYTPQGQGPYPQDAPQDPSQTRQDAPPSAPQYAQPVPPVAQTPSVPEPVEEGDKEAEEGKETHYLWLANGDVKRYAVDPQDPHAAIPVTFDGKRVVQVYGV